MKTYSLLKSSFLTKSDKVRYYVDGVRVSALRFATLEKTAGSLCCLSTAITGDKVQQRKIINCN